MRKAKKVQTLIFDKHIFKCGLEVKKWIRKNKYKLVKKKLYANKKQYRAMQINANKFKRGSLKKIKLKKGVIAIKGFLK